MLPIMERYLAKIKTVDEIVAAVGARPREQKVIMCHGVFDIVHPGHIRHLVHAKSKAPVLITSITADHHITKGPHRPHVPQDLRAANLAAFEMVDYVLVDTNDNPLENIRKIQPDFFAKGYEYISGGMPPKTSQEAEVVTAYGGEIIFTPGDIVYSSSNLINLAPPRISTEKLLLLLDKEGISFDRLREAVTRLGGKRVHVVGDTIVDSHTYTVPIGASGKTPTLSVAVRSRVDFVGGAGIIAKHLQAAGADVTFSTVLGDDPLRYFVLNDLTKAGVKVRPVVDQTRVTTNKNTIIADDYRLLKLDSVDNHTISDRVLLSLENSLRDTPSDAVLFCDFRHGMFNRRTIPRLTMAIPQGAYRVADSQVASRWGNITEFRGFDLITPNEREARFALGDQDSGIRPLAARLYDAAQCKTLILKLGDRGALTCRNSNHEQVDSFMVVESFADRVVDAVGAGDALIAYATLAMLATGSEVIATLLGTLAAACECERDGNIPISPADILVKLGRIQREANYLGPEPPP